MLTPEQLIPFLRHEDPEVRTHAILYLAGAHDPSPATADDVWGAADALGAEQSTSLMTRLELLPQTDESVARTLAALPASSGDGRADLVRVIRSLDFPLLRRHWEAIRGSAEVPPDVTEHLSQRLALADEPVEPLWERMVAQAAALDDRPFTETEALAAERLIEALARRPDLFRERALALLRDPSAEDWREVFCADLVGEMKLGGAEVIDLLLDKLRAEEADLLWETAAEALVRGGDALAVERIAARFPGEDWGFRVSAAGVLGRFKRPEAEAAILRLLPGEQDAEVVTFLATSLLDLCPTDPAALEAVRQVVVSKRYEPGTADLRPLLLAVGQMTGYQPPEAAAWREAMAAERARWERGATDDEGLMAAVQSLPFGTDAFVPVGPTGQMFGLPDARPLPPLGRQRGPRVIPGQRQVPGRRGAATYAPAQQAGTVRRTAAKVGRNDPCPCGSGKKYKKCCMRD